MCTLPNSVAIGDLNGDGKPDLAMTDSYHYSVLVLVLLGNGDGTFQATLSYGVGRGPFSLAMGDLNGDGKPDLAVTNGSDRNISVLLGNGDGTFQTAVNYGAGPYPTSLAIGDLNDDGKPDLAVTNTNNRNNVAVLLGNGDGTFQAPVHYVTGWDPYSVAIGDLNGDGKLDLATANLRGNNVSVLLGNGDGTFQATVNFGAGEGPRSVAIGDLNGDDNPDLAVANSFDDNVSVLLGNGDGTFQAAASFGAGLYPLSLAIGDLNDDGKPDLAVANLVSSNVSILLGNWNGSFQAAVNYSAGEGPSSVAVGDLNGDDKPDLAVTNHDDYSVNNVSMLLNTSLSLFITQQPASQTVTEGQNATFSVTADGAVAYRWRRNGVPLVDGERFGGVTSSELTVTGATIAEAGAYDVEIVLACYAVVTSSPAALNVEPTIWYRDADGDGDGYAGEAVLGFTQPAGHVADDADCNDSDPGVHPGATDVPCDGIDQDCDGVDSCSSNTLSVWYRDADGDGFGDVHQSVLAFTQPGGYVADGADCNDGDPGVHPGATDVPCDGIDQDCDGFDWRAPGEPGGGCIESSDSPAAELAPTAAGLCGMGGLGLLPLTMLGLWLTRGQMSRRRGRLESSR